MASDIQALMQIALKHTNPSSFMDQFRCSNRDVQDSVAAAMKSFHEGQSVKIKWTSYRGTITGFNTRTMGMYSGDRFPIIVKIEEVRNGDTVDPNHDAIGSIFEYSLDQVEAV